MPNKAIPPGRDRLQSRALVGVVVFCFCCLAYLAPQYIVEQGHLTRAYLLQVLVLSVAFAYVAWRTKAATPLAAIAGGITCLLITIFSSIPGNISPFHSGLTPLILLFLLTFTATGIGRGRKVAAGLAESRKGRNSAQVIANLGVAALIGSPLSLRISGWFMEVGYGSREGHILFVALFSMPIVAALAEAAADTVSSEIGQAFGGTPFLVTTLRRVEPGTDGGISLLGTAAGIGAAALVAATGAPALGLSFAECVVAFVAGVLGLFFDSLLGATVERKGWIGNDLVNFVSTAFAAVVAVAAIRFGRDFLLR
jgi:uncharacterized protein (TIGR00297 family)